MEINERIQQDKGVYVRPRIVTGDAGIWGSLLTHEINKMFLPHRLVNIKYCVGGSVNDR